MRFPLHAARSISEAVESGVNRVEREGLSVVGSFDSLHGVLRLRQYKHHMLART